MPTPAVISPPESFLQIKRGINALGDLLAITLGPSQGVVLSTKETQAGPEMLSNSAVIARRVLSLPDRRQDVGAMLLRNLVWRVSQRVGDGGAITAVMTKAMFAQACRYLSAGVNPVALQRGLKQAAEMAVQYLADMSQPVGDSDWFSYEGEDNPLEAVAQAVTNDPELSFVLAEMFELLGKDAYIHIQDYVAPYLEREYLQGGRWEAGLVSAYFASSPDGRRAVLHAPRVLIYRGAIKEYDQVEPVLRLLAKEAKGEAQAAGERKNSLLIAAEEISGGPSPVWWPTISKATSISQRYDLIEAVREVAWIPRIWPR